MVNMVRVYKPTGIRNYWISDHGDIINNDCKDRIIMKQMTTNDGHKRIQLMSEYGIAKKYYVHRLVYQTFNGPLEDDMIIEHLDGNPSNNHYKNLKQSTQKENIETALKQGTFGRNHCKKVEVLDRISGDKICFDSIKDLYDELNVPIGNGSFNKLVNKQEFKDRFILLN